MKAFNPHNTKQVIRSQWCGPLIAQLGNKLTYLGLPAKGALDVSNWLAHLNNIIAFQCQDHRDDGVVSWNEAAELRTNLLKFERQTEVNFSLYRGFIEEVVISGRDVVDGTPLTITSPVNIYNLDFCNNLTSPLTYFDLDNNPQEAYKLDAVGKLLEIQRDLSSSPAKKRFIMFLTVHSSINEKSLMIHAQELSAGAYQQYSSSFNKLKGIERNIRLIKLSIFNFIKTHFCSRCFIPELLPPIYYQGTGDHKLLTFTILGEYKKTATGTAPMHQQAATFLNNKFISAGEDGLSLHSLQNMNEKNISTNPVELFKASHFYKNLNQSYR